MCKSVLFIFAAVCLLATGCGTSSPKTSTLISGPTAEFATAMVSTSDGGLEYADSSNGNFYKVDKFGKGDGQTLAHVELSSTTRGDITGMTVDATGRTFAAWVDKVGRLTVGQIAPGPTRVTWQGPPVRGNEIVGRLAFSPYGRVIVSMGNTDSATYTGTILSIDPDGLPTQIPNIISKNWNDPYGVAYSLTGALWVADNNHMARASDTGATGQDTKFAKADHPSWMNVYGDKEMAVCFSGTHKLKRYLLSDGVQALPGRVLANDCQYSVIQLKDGRLAYSSGSEIRITAL